MERSMKQYNKEYMKMAMLKHEETFRHQVHELHRLYRVQKLLMNDMKAELKRQKKSSRSRTNVERWNIENDTASHQQHYNYHDHQRRPRRALDLELPAEEFIGKDEADVMLEAGEESNLELTLATGSSSRRNKEDTPFTSDSGASFSSSSTDSGGMKLNGREWGLFQVPDINMGSYQIERKSSFNVDEHMMQDRVKQPPWLFQCLSLNMTI